LIEYADGTAVEVPEAWIESAEANVTGRQNAGDGRTTEIKDDWRINGQEKYLKDGEWSWKKYKRYRKDWDHDHCAFCSEKIAEDEVAEALHEGYSTNDDYYWVCEGCFEDFRKMFGWRLKPQPID
jgi:hypothetical protein